MDYNLLVVEKIEELRAVHPEYTFGEILYSLVTQLKRTGIKVDNRTDFLAVTSEQCYTAMSRALKAEGAEKKETFEEMQDLKIEK